jgi:hypothetical protein
MEYCEENELNAYIQSRQIATLSNNKKPIQDFSTLNFYVDKKNKDFIVQEANY